MTVKNSPPTAPHHAPLYELTPNRRDPDLREYLLTNGTGSFAMGTVSGVTTRRYHSLLNAALHPPVGRINLVPRVGEILLLDGKGDLHELSAHRFVGGNVHPRGFEFLKKFTLGDSAEWTYEVDGVTVVRTLRLMPNSCAAELAYAVKGKAKREVELRVMPMVALRDFHALRRAAGWNMGVHPADGDAGILVEADGQGVRIRTDGGMFVPGPDWWRNFQYGIESERGQDDVEDLFVPGYFSARFTGSGSLTVRIEPEQMPAPLGNAYRVSEPPEEKVLAKLHRAAADFVVRRRTPTGDVGTTILAGYPWFADWGRDTFISLPGLLLTTGRLADAEQVLTLFAQYVSAGMIPNKFDDYSNEPAYNTVDASLWFIHAAHEFCAHGGNEETFRDKLLPACRDIIAGYRDGTRFSIRMDPADGLMCQGDASTQLTWMDAKYGGVAFTPRQGKAVEINALWFHALTLMGETELAGRVGRHFREKFWIDDAHGLYDVIDETREDGAFRDDAIRPNQIFAVSLPNSPLSPEQQRAVVKVVRHHLLTPHGLRSLAAADPHYHGQYTGPQSSRDAAYHNGTVWGWLIGPFVDAYLRIHANTASARADVRTMLAPLLRHMDENCLGQIAEVFEGDAPYRPVGAPAQAWSIAEVLRVASKVM